MKTRKINENDINQIVKKVVNEGSTWAGIKGFFSGKGYNYSKYKYEINEIVTGIRKKLISDDELREKLNEIYINLKKSSADDYQKDKLEDFILELDDIIEKANKRIDNLLNNINKW
jgi:hypothetical protein